MAKRSKRIYYEELHQISDIPVRVLRANDGTYWVNMLDAEALNNTGNPTIHAAGNDTIN